MATTDPAEPFSTLWSRGSNGSTTTLALSNLQLFNYYFGAYIILVVIVFGLFGNCLSVIIFIRRRSQFSVASIYLTCLACADAGNLIMSLRQWFHDGLLYITDKMINIPSGFSPVDCMFKVYFWNVFVFVSSYIIIVYSIERCIAVWFPMLVSTIVTGRLRQVALISILLIPLISYSPMFAIYTTTIVSVAGVDRVICVREWPGWAPTWSHQIFSSWIEFSNRMLPTLIVFFLNLIIVIGARRSRDKRKEMASTGSLADVGAMSRNLFLVSTVYLVTGFPWLVVIIQMDVKKKVARHHLQDIAYFIDIAALAQNINTTNYAINFVIYVYHLKVFRRELKKTLPFRLPLCQST